MLPRKTLIGQINYVTDFNVHSFPFRMVQTEMEASLLTIVVIDLDLVKYLFELYCVQSQALTQTVHLAVE